MGGCTCGRGYTCGRWRWEGVCVEEGEMEVYVWKGGDGRVYVWKRVYMWKRWRWEVYV